MMTRLGFLLTLSLSGTFCAAQDGTVPRPSFSPQASAGYTVTGRVICADTQHAARFAQVMLVPVVQGDDGRGNMSVGRTDLDGRFSMDNIPPGDYFATAQMTGYIDDASAVRSALHQGGDALNAVSSVARVQVSAGGGSVQISLQRGAVVSGAVQWDDGSPAAGVQVSVQTAPTNGTPSGSGQVTGITFQGGAPQFFGGSQTDDRGRFRLSGLSPGSYVVRVNLQTPMPGSAGGSGRFARTMALSVYAPDKLRKTEAAVLTLAAGEERSDVSIVLGLAGMHTVSGAVSSTGATVRSGSVQLTDQTDPSLSRRADIGSDGSFAVPYVPPGNYTLRISASTQAQNSGRGGNSSGETVRFQPTQASITVADGDLSGLSFSVNTASSNQ